MEFNLNKALNSLDDLSEQEESLLIPKPLAIVERDEELNIVWHDSTQSVIENFEEVHQLKKVRF
jgi:hypothetical protein